MLCHRCHAADATCHVTDRLPSGTLEESHYCPACRDAALPGWRALMPPRLLPDALARQLVEACRIAGRPILEDEAAQAARLFLDAEAARAARVFLDAAGPPDSRPPADGNAPSHS